MNNNPLFFDDDTVFAKMVKSVPPKVGEYAYYDSRQVQDLKSYRGIALSKHFLIDVVPHRNKGAYGCHFSSPENRRFDRYVTNHGIIHYLKSTKLFMLDRQSEDS